MFRKLRKSLAAKILPRDLIVVVAENFEAITRRAENLNHSVQGSGHLLSRAYNIGVTIRLQTQSILEEAYTARRRAQ